MAKRITVVVIFLAVVGGAFYIYKFGLKPPSLSMLSGQSDEVTTAKVKTALGLSKHLAGYDVNVKTEAGIVTLTGEVPNDDAKSMAGSIAKDTKGVSDVKNLMIVNPGVHPSAEKTQVADLEIRADLLQALSRSQELAGKNINVKVENEVVTLTGTVDTPAQKNGVDQLARSIDGVTSVTDNLAVTNPQATPAPLAADKPPTDPNQELATRVEFELYRTGAFDVNSMKVKADNGAVTLSGSVRSRAEQLLAERIAQGVDGVKKVTNELKAPGK
ncbi:MAG TPA: BON domain-containing protein [Blastocatellia bacterium]|nr:BON domain-containing protein [Blastocatellia bacterium]